MSGEELLRVIEENVKNSGHLGDWVGWSVRVGDGVDPKDLKLAFGAAGLDESVYPPPPCNATAALRAVKAMRRDLGCRIKRTPDQDTPGRVEWQVVEDVPADQIGDYAGKLANKISYIYADEELVFELPEAQSSVTARQYYERYRDKWPREIVVTMISRHLKNCDAIKLLGGGTWFVRPRYAEEIRQMGSIINSLGQSLFSVIPMPGTESALRTVGHGLADMIDDSLSQLQAEMMGWAKKTPRPTTVERRLRDFRRLRNQAREVAIAFGQANEDLLDSVESMEQDCRKFLGLAVGAARTRITKKKFEHVQPPPQDDNSQTGASQPPARPGKPGVTKRQLQRQCREAGILFKGMSRDDMIQALEAAKAAQ